MAPAKTPVQDANPDSSVKERALLEQLSATQAKGGDSNAFLPLEYLIAFYQQHQLWAKAAQYSHQLVSLWNDAVGPGAVGAAAFEVEEARSLAALGEYAKAEALLTHALATLRETPQVDDASRAIALADLAEILAKEDKTDAALSSFAKAIPALEVTVGLHEPWLLAAGKYDELLPTNGRSDTDRELAAKISTAKSEHARTESRGFVRPKPKKLPPPAYTGEAKRLRVSGTVLLFIEITASGQVENVHVVRPLGLNLDEEATKTVKKWKFEPARDENRAAPFFGQVEVQFRENL